MVKVYVWKDEAYPVYGIDESHFWKDSEVEIPDGLHKRFLKVMAAYDKVQEELSKYSCE